MKKLMMMAAAAATGLAFGAEKIPFSDYGSAMAPVKGNPMAVEFQNDNAYALKDATKDEVLAAFVDDEEAAAALLAQIKGAYATCPIAATQAAAVSQWVMQPDPWYCLFWGARSSGRKVWAKALLTCAKGTKDSYVKQFCLDQLRWCGYPCQAKCIRKLGRSQSDLAVRELAELTAYSLAGPCSCFDPKDPVVGNWGLTLSYPDMSAGHAIITRDEDGFYHALVLWRWASPTKAKSCIVEGNRFRIDRGDFVFEGRVDGQKLTGREIRAGKTVCTVVGWRNPPLEEATTDDAEFGEPIDLLKDGLAGWETMNPKATFGWSFKDGILSNSLGLKPDGSWKGGGANLKSKRADFYDFNLEYDVRFPKKSNSGVYLRGRYECQVVDSYGKPVDCHNMGAYYGRVTPSVAAERPAGEWQHVSVTLFRRHITVVLNGMKIIDNAPVVGVTGGAIDANEFVPGPIYLQGDHSDADYRNMILRPAVN